MGAGGIIGIGLDTLGNVGPGALVVLIVVMILTDRLVTGKRLREVERQRDRWEAIALSALGVAEKLTVQAEVTNEVLTRLPDPGAGKVPGDDPASRAVRSAISRIQERGQP